MMCALMLYTANNGDSISAYVLMARQFAPHAAPPIRIRLIITLTHWKILDTYSARRACSPRQPILIIISLQAYIRHVHSRNSSGRFYNSSIGTLSPQDGLLRFVLGESRCRIYSNTRQVNTSAIFLGRWEKSSCKRGAVGAQRNLKLRSFNKNAVLLQAKCPEERHF
ncbi:hypothetical protein DENSPDRAFT_556905 [Dentipellis sp. KUC8613]|nr:hypothetical protein DENSPDRAFT_556905 [Dentipellis sp. KUC8613]